MLDNGAVESHDLCPTHQKLVDEGNILVVEADPGKSKIFQDDGQVATYADSAARTGRGQTLRRELLENLGVTLAPEEYMFFMDPESFEELRTMVESLKAMAVIAKALGMTNIPAELGL